MFRNFLSLSFVSLAVVSSALVAAPALGSTLTYNFDDGTAQGWGFISPYVGGAVPHVIQIENTSNGWAAAQSGNYDAVSIWPWNGESQHPTDAFASPAFNLDGSGDLTFWMNIANDPFTGVMTVPTALTSISTTSVSSGFLGVALLDATTGNIVLAGSADKTLDYRQSTANAWTAANPGLGGGKANRLGDGWWELRFSQTQLAGLSQSDAYRLVFLHNDSNGEGGLDTISIPGVSTPEPSTLVLLAAGLIGLLCYAWRKRS